MRLLSNALFCLLNVQPRSVMFFDAYHARPDPAASKLVYVEAECAKELALLALCTHVAKQIATVAFEYNLQYFVNFFCMHE